MATEKHGFRADLDLGGKRVVVIGSDATTMTLVPAIAPTAAHVTMLQRSPTYVTAMPSIDPIAAAVRERLPAGAASPSQDYALKPGTPDSATVGTSGAIGWRFAVLTAMARSLLPSTSDHAPGMESNCMVIWPPIT